MIPNLRIKRFSACILGLLLSPIVFGLDDDNTQIAHIVAQKVNLDLKNHQLIYQGNVFFDQGSTHLRAEHIITKGDDVHQVNLAIVQGNAQKKAHYWSTPEKNKPPMHAYADKIEYYPIKHLVKLIGRAHVQQENDSFKAPIIIYNTKTKHVISESDGKTGTTIIFHPKHSQLKTIS